MKKTVQALCLTLAVTLGSSGVASAATIVNASFESPITAFFTPGVPTGWSVTGDPEQVGVFAPNAFPGTYYTGDGTPDGNQVAFMNNNSLFQILTDTYQPDTTYTLQAFIGDRLDSVFPSTALMQLLVNGNVKASASGPIPNDGYLLWQAIHLSSLVDPDLGGQLEVRFTVNEAQMNIDAVELNSNSLTPVPEPATMLLLGTGLLVSFRNRKKFAGK